MLVCAGSGIAIVAATVEGVDDAHISSDEAAGQLAVLDSDETVFDVVNCDKGFRLILVGGGR